MSRSALYDRPRATGPNRAEVFQNLLLTTLAVLGTPAFKPVDHGRPVQLRQSREDVQQQPFQRRTFAGGTTTFRVQTPDLGRPHALPAGRAEVGPNSRLLFAAAPKPIGAGQFDGASRALRTPRDDNYPNLQFTLAQISTSFGGWDEGYPLSLWRRRDDTFPNLQFLLSSQPPPTPVVNSDFGRPIALRIWKQDAQSTNLQLFPPSGASPAKPLAPWDFGDRPRGLVAGPRVETQGLNLQLFGGTPPPAPFTNDVNARPAPMASTRSAEIAPLNLPLLADSAPALLIGREIGERPRTIFAIRQPDPQGVNLQLSFVSIPVAAIDFGKPAALAGRPQDPQPANFQLTYPPGAISGSAQLTFSQSGVLTGTGSIVGAAQLSFSQSGNLTNGLPSYQLTGYIKSQPATISGQLNYLTPPPYVQRPPQVRSRTIDFASVVRMAEGEDYQARLPYPVYQFGGGPVRRYFIQYV